MMARGFIRLSFTPFWALPSSCFNVGRSRKTELAWFGDLIGLGSACRGRGGVGGSGFALDRHGYTQAAMLQIGWPQLVQLVHRARQFQERNIMLRSPTAPRGLTNV